MTIQTRRLISDVLLSIGLCVLAVLMAGLPLGCAVRPDAATQKQVQTITNQSAIAQANTKAKDAVNALHGTDSPVTHPIAAANETVKSLRPWLILLSLIGVFGWIVCFAFSGYLPLLGSFIVPLRWVAILSVTALFTLPFLPWTFLALCAAAIGLVIYELVKTESITGTETAIENIVDPLIGIKPAVTSSATPAASPTATVTAGTTAGSPQTP